MFEEAYSTAFESADALYLSMPVLRHNDNPADFIDGKVIVNNAKNRTKNKDFYAICVQNCDQVLDELVPVLKEGDVVVMMSNGSFDGIYEKIMHRLG
jgi:UDP-N-acetylmuramate: L-alanyl-gamma-D-glutamyl-meso-diaminopimelate ligase